MTPAARIETLIESLERLKRSHKPADSLLSGLFRERRYIGSKDRRFIAECYYRILRHHGRYGWWLNKTNLADKPRARVLLDVIFHQKEHDLGALFDGSQYGPHTLEPKEKKAADFIKKQNLIHTDMDDATRLECPEWIANDLKDVFKDRFEEEMQAMLEPAKLHCRVNTIKSDRKTVSDLLNQSQIQCTKGQLSPLALIIEGRPALSQNKVFQDGFIEIQDEGSQLIGLLCQAKPGDQVVDFCAGAGGKTLAIAASMQNKGRVVACDVLAGKLKRSQVRFRRAGLHNIETRVLSSEKDKWVKKSQGKYNVVLTDVPCSGTGTWKRNPDMKWRILGPDIEELIALQYSILESASRLVKPGGRLVYATCSLLPAENQNQIEKFLSHHNDFSLIPVKDIWDDVIGTTNPNLGDMMTLSPALTKTDGFFAAVLKRKD